jgi:DNA-directed RNA polymerase subunit beta'
MLKTTLGQILVNEALPEDMRDYNRVLTKKDMSKLATELAEKHPDKYREAMKRLHDVGRAAAYSTNGLSFGLKDIKPTMAVREAQFRVQKQLRAILANPRLDEKARTHEILKLASNTQRELVEKVYEEARGTDNPLAHQVLGSGHGNKFSLNSIIGADMQYVDHKNEPIPIPVMRGYSQGLRPVEYFAGAFGTRKGVMDLKTATADAGFFGKQLAQMTHRLLVTADDEDEPERLATAHDRGYPTDVDDADN